MSVYIFLWLNKSFEILVSYRYQLNTNGLVLGTTLFKKSIFNTTTTIYIRYFSWYRTKSIPTDAFRYDIRYQQKLQNTTLTTSFAIRRPNVQTTCWYFWQFITKYYFFNLKSSFNNIMTILLDHNEVIYFLDPI